MNRRFNCFVQSSPDPPLGSPCLFSVCHYRIHSSYHGTCVGSIPSRAVCIYWLTQCSLVPIPTPLPSQDLVDSSRSQLLSEPTSATKLWWAGWNVSRGVALWQPWAGEGRLLSFASFVFTNGVQTPNPTFWITGEEIFHSLALSGATSHTDHTKWVIKSFCFEWLLYIKFSHIHDIHQLFPKNMTQGSFTHRPTC